MDLAGVIEAVGHDVTRFQPGDEVFGIGIGAGAYTQYARVPETKLIPHKLDLVRSLDADRVIDSPVTIPRQWRALRPGERHRGASLLLSCPRGLRVFVVVDGLVTYDDATRNATNIVESSGLFRSGIVSPVQS